MSAPQGGSTPNAFVFPPFVPPAPRTTPPAAPQAEERVMEVPLPAHDLGDPDTELPQAAPAPWEAAAPPAADDDLPWLEMPAGGSRVHVAEEPAAPPADDEMAGWAGWEASTAPESVADLAPAAEPAAESWDAIFAPAEDFAADTPAEHALLAEVEPATEFPTDVATPAAEAEAALEFEAAGLAAEVPTPDADATPAAAEWAARQAIPAPAPAAPVAALAFAAAPASAGLDEVAERLELIARALRSDPDGFLAGGSADPLGLLVTGFVLGYRQRNSA
jgi:hypothetical protein